MVVVVVVVATAEADVAAGAAPVVVSRCGIASDSECEWEMYRTRRAKAARIYAHEGQRVQQNFFTRAQCAPSTLSPTRAYPRLTPALWIAAWRLCVRQRTKLCSSRCNEDVGNYARPLEPPRVSGKLNGLWVWLREHKFQNHGPA